MNKDRFPPLDYDHRDGEPPNFTGCGRVVLLFWLIVVLLFSLTGCAGVKSLPTALTQKSVTIGDYECDPTGACWPKDFVVTKHIRYQYVEDVQQVCRTEEDMLARPDWTVYACTLLEDTQSPIVVLPNYWFPEWLKRHEEGHAEGVTVHDMRESIDRHYKTRHRST